MKSEESDDYINLFRLYNSEFNWNKGPALRMCVCMCVCM